MNARAAESLLHADPYLAVQWHPVLNGSLTSADVSSRSSKKVWWRCNNGHHWKATVNDRAGGRGCPFCSGNRVWAGFNDLATVCPQVAEEWHPDLNEDLTPAHVTSGSGKKIWWLCREDHHWQATVSSRVGQGTGCPFCSGRQAWAGFNDLATVCPTVAAQWHPDLNEDLTPAQVTSRSSKRIWWLCENDHHWRAAISNRTGGSGCPYCAGNLVWAGLNDLASVRPDIAAQWHPDLNDGLTPAQVTSRANRKVWWLCDNGHTSHALISDKSGGVGCPIAADSKRSQVKPTLPRSIPAWLRSGIQSSTTA